ncbi:MAG: hypothetical protein AAGF32_03440 [Pseudomonadota bacterium]
MRLFVFSAVLLSAGMFVGQWQERALCQAAVSGPGELRSSSPAAADAGAQEI